ncbi:sigma-70 family RNA polymerase sigma factor [Sulfidibacter corallicola]|uniref:Sigma-70 family RNA polymerase sigma factor n=1 Tax=Sulfidibacter corallicola TaxID=2818388 RepID=A0A8A4TNR9_SULCO|nr:sigma-70 family RNA polymerase sigma factor [Sulfidibacter corallicola]QTD50742.1 sigma-70 family RNA polymerase sigma factor [Sulfidibacter corallicola]
MNEKTGTITHLLRAFQGGDDQAFSKLIELFHPQLEEVAKACLAGDGMHDFMQTQSLVQEYFLRLSATNQLQPYDSKAFRSFAYKGMRRIVIDKARRQRARIKTVPPTEENDAMDHDPSFSDVDRLWLEQALERLDEAMPGMGVLAQLKYLGYSKVEIASILEMSPTRVVREWNKCKLFLKALLVN